MVICKVPVKRPLPCIVILVHGVNDDGHCYSTIDRGICAGLNKRLGRDDLFPHEWHKSEHLLTPGSNGVCEAAEVIKKEGRSPVVPFYWGYRPVDHQTYRADQERYAAELRKGGPDITLPYDSYWLDHSKAPKQGYAYKDKFGNWLNDRCAKNGGLFANATTNIPDMWGPGTDSFGWSWTIAGATRLRDDKTHAMYSNAHRIYLVHAAQRLADLIATIRNDPDMKNDTVNIIAHSQGTIISMLANLMLEAMDNSPRPVDAMILAHSPYGLEGTFAENMTYGLKQKDSARMQTLANVCSLLWEKRKPTTDEKILSWGVARKDAWNTPGHGRNSFGLVYNYFCPNDQTVSMRSVQGMGWQGVSDELLAKIGPNFRQRAFAEGRTVGGAAGTVFSMQATYAMGQSGYPVLVSNPGETAKGALSVSFGARKRTINADALPETFRFKLMAHRLPLDDIDAQIQLSAEGATDVVSRVFDPKTGVESGGDAPLPMVPGKRMEASVAQTLLQRHGIEATVLQAWTLPDGRMQVNRYETRQEAIHRIQKSLTVETSQHSSIVESAEVAEKAMAYDLAIGGIAAFDREEKWWSLHHRADWRHPKNPKEDAKIYYQTGILPGDIKDQMNKVPEIAGLVNDYAVPPTPLDPERQAVFDINRQWRMPNPDLKG
ncbi:Transmembrane protein [Paraburkholderia sacchari]|uniref:T6SS effector phospholipase Tle3 domain-containing protein n=1 Tax=Paraburkholderia sacchari TaxID=159450 RepID=UPI0039A5515A